MRKNNRKRKYLKLIITLVGVLLIGYQGFVRADRYQQSTKERQEYELAVVNHTQAIAANPNDIYTYFDRGVAYYHLEEYELAVADYTKALGFEAISPDDYYSTHRKRADAYFAWGRYEQAQADYGVAAEFDPG